MSEGVWQIWPSGFCLFKNFVVVNNWCLDVYISIPLLRDTLLLHLRSFWCDWRNVGARLSIRVNNAFLLSQDTLSISNIKQNGTKFSVAPESLQLHCSAFKSWENLRKAEWLFNNALHLIKFRVVCFAPSLWKYWSTGTISLMWVTVKSSFKNYFESYGFSWSMHLNGLPHHEIIWLYLRVKLLSCRWKFNEILNVCFNVCLIISHYYFSFRIFVYFFFVFKMHSDRGEREK